MKEYQKLHFETSTHNNKIMKCKTCGHEVEETVIQSISAKNLEWGPTSANEMEWDDAKKWCEIFGYRMPTSIELIQAHEDNVSGFMNDCYWSDTETSPTGAWNVNMSSGSAIDDGKTSSSYYVRCVRDIE